MKKLLSLILSSIMLVSLASCGGSNNDEPTPPAKEKQYTLLYRVVMAKDLFKIANFELTVLNPVTDKTETLAITESMDNRNDADCKYDYAVVTAAMTAASISPENYVIYYYKVNNVKGGMAYNAKVKVTLDEAKTADIDKTQKINYSTTSINKSCVVTDGSYVDVPTFSVNATTGTIERVMRLLASGKEYSIDGTITLKK